MTRVCQVCAPKKHAQRRKTLSKIYIFPAIHPRLARFPWLCNHKLLRRVYTPESLWCPRPRGGLPSGAGAPRDRHREGGRGNPEVLADHLSVVTISGGDAINGYFSERIHSCVRFFEGFSGDFFHGNMPNGNEYFEFESIQNDETGKRCSPPFPPEKKTILLASLTLFVNYELAPDMLNLSFLSIFQYVSFCNKELCVFFFGGK